MTETNWELLRRGDGQEAIRRMREAWAGHGTTSHIVELGVAYLWAQDYSGAWEHFDLANHKNPNHASITYEMAGVAKWCLNEPEEAVHQWRQGCHSEFVDVAGGMTAPFLLFVASILSPRAVARAEAENLLIARANDPRVRNWPGPVAEYILGRIDENALRSTCSGRHEGDTNLRHWLAGFYVGVLEHANGNIAHYRELIHETATTSDDDFDRSKRQYLRKLWHGEFFIARHEASKQLQG